MVYVQCRTNLDLRGEQWPTELPAVPHVGDLIQSSLKHQGGFQLTLEVYRVTWVSGGMGEWYPSIELHMNSFQRGLPAPKGSSAQDGSIVAFYHWYARCVGRDVACFI